MLIDSSSVTRSAGSAVVPPACPLIHSRGAGSGSGMRSRSIIADVLHALNEVPNTAFMRPSFDASECGMQ